MRENNEKDCNINDSIHDVPPEKDCGHPVMEGPGVNPDGSLVKTTDGETIRKDAGRIGPGMISIHASAKEATAINTKNLRPFLPNFSQLYLIC